jgi:2-amino-4-hydroxy-6-hydroxymethyldihydropteridine diphosphokinase
MTTAGRVVADRVIAYVGLGANLGEPRQQLTAALTAMSGLPQTRLAGHSSFYRTAPMGYEDQPEFLNAVAALDTRLAPGVLLEGLQGIERRHGRERQFANAPRTLDLDLLLFGAQQIARPGLTVPHPRMHLRAFVLQPLLELDSEISIPGKGKASALLAACDSQKIERVN